MIKIRTASKSRKTEVVANIEKRFGAASKSCLNIFTAQMCPGKDAAWTKK